MTTLTAVWAIAWANLVRLFRDRSNLFFVVIFPIVLIAVFGLSFGSGFQPPLGVADADGGPQAARLVRALEQAGHRVVRVGSAEEARDGVERGRLAGALVIPAGYERALRGYVPLTLPYLGRNEPDALQLGAAVRAAVTRVTMPARAAAYARDGSFDELVARAEAAPAPGVTVAASTVGTATALAGMTGYDVAATSQLLLFMFLTSMNGATALIESRQLGVSRRMYATPVTSRGILLGEAAGRVGVALLQGLIIMAGSALLFGVRWGDPAGAVALLLAFALVGGGAGMLLGAAARTGQQATALGLLLALGLAAIGGAMVPLDFFSATLRRLAHLTPHAWALDGFAELLRRDGTLADVLPQLGVLAAYAAAFFALGAWRLRKALTAGP
ncbi:ABC transporter permease [Actinomadura sp. ATCC 31491]|uniref:ABC transporter permease n=1 Tax=Actinomadura luzonensis TaxID=2805427 RepID=A0ABT0FYS9_9ACTN|nr:ABC transporter permease [Actinomadura luzonensis]MCK2217477.1 ABC transporter permease [Actinomadura luzonensis]